MWLLLRWLLSLLCLCYVLLRQTRVCKRQDPRPAAFPCSSIFWDSCRRADGPAVFPASFRTAPMWVSPPGLVTAQPTAQIAVMIPLGCCARLARPGSLCAQPGPGPWGCSPAPVETSPLSGSPKHRWVPRCLRVPGSGPPTTTTFGESCVKARSLMWSQKFCSGLKPHTVDHLF